MLRRTWLRVHDPYRDGGNYGRVNHSAWIALVVAGVLYTLLESRWRGFSRASDASRP